MLLTGDSIRPAFKRVSNVTLICLLTLTTLLIHKVTNPEALRAAEVFTVVPLPTNKWIEGRRASIFLVLFNHDPCYPLLCFCDSRHNFYNGPQYFLYGLFYLFIWILFFFFFFLVFFSFYFFCYGLFIVFCQFLLCSKVTQSHTHIYTFLFSHYSPSYSIISD